MQILFLENQIFNQNFFLQNFKAINLPKTDKKCFFFFFFIRYSWQALLFCNKPFDHLKNTCLTSFYLLSFKTTKSVPQKKKKIWTTDPVVFGHLQYNLFFIRNNLNLWFKNIQLCSKCYHCTLNQKVLLKWYILKAYPSTSSFKTIILSLPPPPVPSPLYWSMVCDA